MHLDQGSSGCFRGLCLKITVFKQILLWEEIEICLMLRYTQKPL